MKALILACGDAVAKRHLALDHAIIVDHMERLGSVLPRHDSRVCPSLIRAVMAAEDRRFFQHLGFDVRAIIRAVTYLIARRTVSGASTIDQQLVRVIRKRYEFTLRRKLGEIVLAVALNARYPKARIFEAYMDQAYFGWKGNGIGQICNRLELDPNALTDKEARKIAAMLKLPMPEQPSSSYVRRLERRVRYIEEYQHRQAELTDANL